MEPRAVLDRCEKSRPPPGFDPRTVQPVASRYTDYATWPILWDMSPYNLLPPFGKLCFGVPWTLYLCKKHSALEDETWIYIVANCTYDGQYVPHRKSLCYHTHVVNNGLLLLCCSTLAFICFFRFLINVYRVLWNKFSPNHESIRKFQRNNTVRGVRAVMLRTDRQTDRQTDRHNGIRKGVARAGRPRNPCLISDSDMSFFYSPNRAE